MSNALPYAIDNGIKFIQKELFLYQKEILLLWYVMLMFDIFLSRWDSDIRFIIAIPLFMWFVRFYKLTNMYIMRFCMYVMAAFAYAVILHGFSDAAERASVWLVLYFCVGLYSMGRDHMRESMVLY